MNQSTFEECYKHYKSNFKLGETWSSLSKIFGYKDGEHLRWSFKDERKKRHIPGKNSRNRMIIEEQQDNPRVGVVDFETLPAIVYTFRLYDQNIGINQIITDVCLLSWAGKFLNESKMYSDILTPKEAKSRDIKRIVKSCWDFLSECDVVIGHNYRGFDEKIINSAFLECGFPPLKYKVVDTLTVARQNFKFSSNKLAYLNKKLGIRNKIENEGFPLWSGCSDGDSESLDTMLEYNEGDISATEELFYKLRPYVRGFNIALYNEINTPICPVCGSEDLKEEGFYYTSAGKWHSIRCQNCQCISRGKENLFDKYKKKSLLVKV